MRYVFSASAVLDVALALVFNKWWRLLWRTFPSLNRVVYPDLDGNWDVTIHWQWGEQMGVVKANAEIKQTLLHMSISLHSDLSDSVTLSVVPKRDPESGRPSLHYLYRNETIQGAGPDIPPHNGAAILQLDLNDNNVLKGNYFTDRATKGHYVMRRA